MIWCWHNGSHFIIKILFFFQEAIWSLSLALAKWFFLYKFNFSKMKNSQFYFNNLLERIYQKISTSLSSQLRKRRKIPNKTIFIVAVPLFAICFFFFLFSLIGSWLCGCYCCRRFCFSHIPHALAIILSAMQ